jgi:hypothetical protein
VSKKTAFTFFRKINEAKKVTFGQKFKLDDILSVFSEEGYIFENKCNLTTVGPISLNMG